MNKEKIKIGIDARQISHGKRHGLRTYVENLIMALSRIDKKNKYVLYVDGKNSFILESLGPNFTIVVLPWQVNYLSTFLNDHIFLPLHAIKDKVDVMHYAANLVNFMQLYNSRKTVATVHDAISFFEKGRPIISRLHNRGIFEMCINWYNSTLIKYNTRKAIAIITISAKSREDLVRLADLSQDRFTVIHSAANDNFRKIRDKERIEDIRSKYNLGGKYILGFGHKNGARIVEAYTNLPQRTKAQYRLSLICLKNGFPKDLQIIIDERKINNSVICIPPVSEEDLVMLYNGASLFVFPSFYEGFGLPVLEAMKCGCPVICSNRGSLPEVANNAAVFVKELDNVSICVKELSEKIEMVLGDKVLQKILIEKGLDQAKKFSWKKTAERTLEVYREICRIKK